MSGLVALLLGSAAIAFAPQARAATAPITLATAGSFAVLAGSGVTNTGPTTIVGDSGTFPTPSETGWSSMTQTGTNHVADAVTQQAKKDLTAAYGVAAGAGPGAAVATELGGLTLQPGVYTSPTLGITGTLTLDTGGNPNAVFIFQASSTLITASDSSMVVLHGGTACNVFWQIGSSATLGTNSHLIGSVLALTSISATTGATIAGRLLARNGAVTMDTNTITTQPCATAATTTTLAGVTSTVAATTTTALGATTTMLPTTTAPPTTTTTTTKAPPTTTTTTTKAPPTTTTKVPATTTTKVPATTTTTVLGAATTTTVPATTTTTVLRATTTTVRATTTTLLGAAATTTTLLRAAATTTTVPATTTTTLASNSGLTTTTLGLGTTTTSAGAGAGTTTTTVRAAQGTTTTTTGSVGTIGTTSSTGIAIFTGLATTGNDPRILLGGGALLLLGMFLVVLSARRADGS